MPRVTTAERFWALTHRPAGECWEWLGRKDERGYGRIGFYGKPNRRAHRVAWALTHGPVTEGMCVLHRCDNPGCVNPDHLFLGTQLENIADRDRKSRTANPPSRKKLDVEQVRLIRSLARSGWTQEQIAAEFPVSRGNVSKIVNRRSYTNVA